MYTLSVYIAGKIDVFENLDIVHITLLVVLEVIDSRVGRITGAELIKKKTSTNLLSENWTDLAWQRHRVVKTGNLSNQSKCAECGKGDLLKVCDSRVDFIHGRGPHWHPRLQGLVHGVGFSTRKNTVEGATCPGLGVGGVAFSARG